MLGQCGIGTTCRKCPRLTSNFGLFVRNDSMVCSSGLDRFTSSWSNRFKLAGWLAKVQLVVFEVQKVCGSPLLLGKSCFCCGSVLIFLTFRNFLCRFLSPRYYGVPWLKCTYGWGAEMIGAGPPKPNANRTCINHQLIQSFALPEVLPNLPTLSLSLSFVLRALEVIQVRLVLFFFSGGLQQVFFFPIHDIDQ